VGGALSHVLPNHVLIAASLLESDYQPSEIRRLLTLASIKDLFVLETSIEASESGRIDFGQMDLQQLSELCFSKFRSSRDKSVMDLGDAFYRLHQIAVGR
jgi:hypothetical protein